MSPPLNILSTVQVFMDSTFYGCFVMLFTVSVVVLNKRSRTLEARRRRSAEKEDSTADERKELRFWKTLGTTMIVLTTCHWAFLWSTMLSPAGDRMFRSQMSFMRFLFEMLNVIVGDALILSRLWTVGGKRPIVIACPLLCLLAFIACSIRLTDLEAKHLLLFKENPADIRWWFTATMALTASVNLYSTIYIAWRAWSANQLAHKTLYTYFMACVDLPKDRKKR
ncbi:hypothetical protein D9756_008557 [Leucocoprinus leucothites]|uniref:Uncharacterized protein n=1 Tax=Leucocoprinus leucothites TaxID=201217 RepID=A0A8H5D043_9AGAR|nr:hypothetical protein D9756_008557 [Leucoagaricus leucothites]